MNSTKGDPPGEPPDAAKGAAEDDPSRTKTSGRTAFDSRGNAVWEWRTDTGQFTKDTSTTVLRKIEESGLAIEATVIAKAPEQLDAKATPRRAEAQPFRSRCGQQGAIAVKPPAATDAGQGSRTDSGVAPPVSTKTARNLGERIRDALEAFRDRRK